MSKPAVDLLWSGNCRDPQIRYRLLGYLHRLAALSDGYIRRGAQPVLSLVNDGQAAPRQNIEVVDETISGPIIVKSDISLHPETLITRATEAGLPVMKAEGGKSSLIEIETARLRGLDFKLFNPQDRHSGESRMSFVFVECSERHFLDGRLVMVENRDGIVYLNRPSLRLPVYLEDWTDCLFSWVRFFLVGDFWWQRVEELQGYAEYRGVLEEIQTTRGTAHAEEATFDAVLSTFSQHAEYALTDVSSPMRVEQR